MIRHLPISILASVVITGLMPLTASAQTPDVALATIKGEAKHFSPALQGFSATTGERFNAPPKLEKRFKHNCSDVSGRPCTAQEKGDVLACLLAVKL